MSQIIKNITIKRAYLARLYSLCTNFAEDDVSVSILKNNLIFGGMNPKSSFEFSIQEAPNKSLSDFLETSSKTPENIYFSISKDDFSKILAPFSKSGGSERPKKDTDLVSLEIKESSIQFLQENLKHESKEIMAKMGDGTWSSLPSEDWELMISPEILSEYTQRMTSSGGPTIKFKQENDSLHIISEAGVEKVSLQTLKQSNCQIDVSRMSLMKVKAQLNDYESTKVGVRNSFLMIEGKWKHCICKWKLDAIS